MIVALIASLVLAPAPTLQIRVDGEGCLRFLREGRVVYARQAVLKVDHGQIVHDKGPTLLPAIYVSGTPQKIDVDLEGHVTAQYGGTRRDVGRLVLGMFPEGAPAEESEGFLVSRNRPKLGNPGEDTCGVIRVVGVEPEVRVHAAAPEPKKNVPPPKTVVEQPKTVSEQPKRGAAGLMANKLPTEPEPASENDDATAPTAPVNASTFKVQPPSAEFLKKGGVQIVLNDVTDIDTESYTLGQVATVYAKADLASVLTGIELGKTPPVGVETVLDRVRVKARLRANGLDSDRYIVTGPLNAKVRRKAQRIGPETLEAHAIAAGKQKLGEFADLVATAHGPEMVLPLGQLVFAPEGISGNGNQLSVTVAVYVDGKRFNSRTIQLINKSPISTVKVGATLKVRVRSGDALVETNGKVKSIDIATNQVAVVTDMGATLVGKVVDGGIVEVKL